jgi:outer membrane protein OmpA-like peptidoglycan-associated protein
MRLFLCAVLVLIFSGCETRPLQKRESGALGGAALGAGLGAIVGNQTGHAGEGVAIGSAIGALSGGLIGNQMDNADDRHDERERRLDLQDRELEENRKLIAELRSRGADVRSTDRGVVVNLPDVLFEFDSAKLTGGARNTATDIAHAVEGTGRNVVVEGHTDSVGTDSYNQRLSEDRAHAVADELAYDGVPRSQLQSRGYGERRPIASNDSAHGRSQNRRVEVIIEN